MCKILLTVRSSEPHSDLLLITAPGVQWFERILASSNVLTWFLNPFVIASVASFIYAATREFTLKRGLELSANE